MKEILFRPIGVIHSSFSRPADMPVQPAAAAGAEGWVEILPEYGDGLADLDGFSHIVLVYHLHLSDGFRLRVKPFLDDEPRGLFSTRAPSRPNPIGVSVVRLLGVEGSRLRVSGLDIVDGTPLLDIKPHVPDFAVEDGEVRIGWLAPHRERIRNRRSDNRFAEGAGGEVGSGVTDRATSQPEPIGVAGCRAKETEMSNQELIDGLNHAMNREVSTFLRYLLQAASIKGAQWEAVRNLYQSEVADEVGHAQYLADKIVMLGGVPKLAPDLTPPPKTVPEMLRHDIEEEVQDVEGYSRLAELADQAGLVDLKLKMEDQAADEAGHADVMRRMLGE